MARKIEYGKRTVHECPESGEVYSVATEADWEAICKKEAGLDGIESFKAAFSVESVVEGWWIPCGKHDWSGAFATEAEALEEWRSMR